MNNHESNIQMSATFPSDGTIALESGFLLNQILTAETACLNSGKKPPKIPVADLKRDLPVYFFLSVFAILAVMSLWALTWTGLKL